MELREEGHEAKELVEMLGDRNGRMQRVELEPRGVSLPRREVSLKVL